MCSPEVLQLFDKEIEAMKEQSPDKLEKLMKEVDKFGKTLQAEIDKDMKKSGATQSSTEINTPLDEASMKSGKEQVNKIFSKTDSSNLGRSAKKNTRFPDSKK